MLRTRWAVIAAACWAGAAWADPSSAALGRKLFEGEVAIPATIAGQGVALPAMASRCTNCHLRETQSAPAPSAAARTQRFGPVLTATQLRSPSRRRGGPPSSYDNGSFCKLLRTGIDPAYVIVDRNMPRFEIGNAECEALWAYLTEPR